MNSPQTRTVGERFQIGASLVPPFALLWLAARKGWMPGDPRLYLLTMLAVAIVGWVIPSPFVPWHRGVSRVQSWLGRKALALLLGMVFVAVVLPVGLLYRLTGKSFIASTPGESLWKPARTSGSLRDQF